MPAKMALVNPLKCQPEKCDNGICLAAEICKHKVLRQIDGAYELPAMLSSSCRGCGDCVRLCPLDAIQIVMV
ncbi:MAG: 4Fe-4S binding protein [Dehalococcoidales bacterium]